MGLRRKVNKPSTAAKIYRYFLGDYTGALYFWILIYEHW